MNVLGFLVNIVILLAAVFVAVFLLIKFSVSAANEISKDWKRDAKKHADDDWEWENWGKDTQTPTFFMDKRYSGISGNAFYTDDDDD